MYEDYEQMLRHAEHHGGGVDLDYDWVKAIVDRIDELIDALQFYADLKYSHKTGFPPEVQWIAENAIRGKHS